MEIIEYEPAWNGALEAQGLAPGLSSYRGSSSILPAIEDEPALKHGECKTPSQPATDDQIRAALARGDSYARICAALCTSTKRVSRIARRLGMDLGRRYTRSRYQITPERERAVLVALRAGVSYRKLAREYGVPVGVARGLVRKHGIAAGKREAAALAARGIAR